MVAVWSRHSTILELLAVPNCATGTQTCAANPTDVYAGAINLYKCSINAANPTCSDASFLNLTHVYGCDPLGACRRMCIRTSTR